MSFGEVTYIIGNIVVIIGILCMLVGAYGLFKFRDFYPRLLIATKIDTVGLMTLLFGICIINGFSFFSLKVLFIILIILILNPLTAHLIAQAAYRAGYQLEGTLTEEDGEEESGNIDAKGKDIVNNEG